MTVISGFGVLCDHRGAQGTDMNADFPQRFHSTISPGKLSRTYIENRNHHFKSDEKMIKQVKVDCCRIYIYTYRGKDQKKKKEKKRSKTPRRTYRIKKSCQKCQYMLDENTHTHTPAQAPALVLI